MSQIFRSLNWKNKVATAPLTWKKTANPTPTTPQGWTTANKHPVYAHYKFLKN